MDLSDLYAKQLLRELSADLRAEGQYLRVRLKGMRYEQEMKRSERYLRHEHCQRCRRRVIFRMM